MKMSVSNGVGGIIEIDVSAYNSYGMNNLSIQLESGEMLVFHDDKIRKLMNEILSLI